MSAASTNMSISSKIFVGGIPFNSTERELTQFFSQYGRILSTVVPRNPKNGKPRGFAFITFEEKKSSTIALEGHNTLRGKKMTLRPAMSNDKASQHTKKLQGLKIFARGFPLNTTEEEIEQFFSTFGQVDRVLMGNSSQKRKFKGFAYIIMGDKKSYRNVFDMGIKGSDCLEFRGYSVEIQPAKVQKEVSKLNESMSSNEKISLINCGGSIREHPSFSNDSNSYNSSANEQLEFEISFNSSSHDSDSRHWKPRTNSITKGCSNNKNEQSQWFGRPAFRQHQHQQPHSERQRSLFHSYNSRRPSYDYQSFFDSDSGFTSEMSNNSDCYCFGNTCDCRSAYLDSLTGDDLVRRHNLVWRQSSDSEQDGEYLDDNYRVTTTNHQDMNFASFTTGGGFSDTSRPLPRRNQMFGPHNAFGDNQSDPRFMRDGDSSHFVAQTAVNQQRHGEAQANFNYLGPVFIPGSGIQTTQNNDDAQETETGGPSVEIKQTITTEYFVKNQGVVYHGTINETNVWGSHPHQNF